MYWLIFPLTALMFGPPMWRQFDRFSADRTVYTDTDALTTSEGGGGIPPNFRANEGGGGIPPNFSASEGGGGIPPN